MVSQNVNDAANGIFGFICSVILAVPAYIEQVEVGLKLISLSLSVIVAILTIIKLTYSIRHAKGEKRKKAV
jgi:hypothetical protein